MYQARNPVAACALKRAHRRHPQAARGASRDAPTFARHGGALDCYSRATESLRFPRQRMYVPTHLRGTAHAGGRGLSDSSTFSIG
ncbi:allophanate hydrolase [Ralstonia solanacearum]|nr:allophanate hydrolase [Ralstonia solanacearum]